METIYVTQEKCSVKREGEHIKLVRMGQALATVPLVNTRTIILHDSVNITSPAMDLLLGKGIDIIYQSRTGKTKGRVISTKGGGAITRLAQFAAFVNLNRRLEISKSIVSAKTQNQMSVVKKYQYYGKKDCFKDSLRLMKSYAEQLESADKIETIFGLEGMTAKIYWDCFRRVLKDHVFLRREYRPAHDYINALLNLGYSFLAYEMTTCLLAKKFDLEIGFLHSIHYGRNSLALDMMEEFRPVFIDAWVLSIFNKHQLSASHFENIEGDWRLTGSGFGKFCRLYHERMPLWSSKFREQANNLKNALIMGEAYEPYLE